MDKNSERLEEEIAEHSGGARFESFAAGWGRGGDYIREMGYCVRLSQNTLCDKVCTGFFWIDDYTPVIGCMTCRYWRKEI